MTWLLMSRYPDMLPNDVLPREWPVNLARNEGYVILNTIELRKNLADDREEARGQVEALGLTWKVL